MSNFPKVIDTDETIPQVYDNISEIGAEAINASKSAVLAIENTLGIDPQGTADSVAARISVSLNSNGTIKSSALDSAGIASLPIDNADVASNAGIKESKLNLDYPTEDLKNEIATSAVDITTLQSQFSNLDNDFIKHINGLDFRHDGYQIDIEALSGDPATTNIQTGIHFVWNSLVNHKESTISGEHKASAVSYEPVVDGIITATNVQDAISGTDSAFVEDRRRHNDYAHTDGISKDGYVYFNGQGAVNDASMMVGRMVPPSAGNIYKLGQVNAATGKTKNLNLLGLGPTSNSIDIEAFSGNSARTISIIGLETAVYPIGTTVSIQGIVNAINSAMALDFFPAMAFESDGELVIQHNIARDDCSLIIKTPSGNSAVDALGFSAIVNQEIKRINNYVATINGSIFENIKIRGQATSASQAFLSSTLDLGQDVGAGGLGLFNGSLIHIYNHSTSSANGTYLIQTVSVSPGTSVSVNTGIPAGTYSYIIYQDSFKLESGPNKKTYDFYVSDDGYTVASKRAEVISSAISGLNLIQVSENYPIGSSSITLSKTGTTYSMFSTVDGNSGALSNFSEGYIGNIKVWAPDNCESLTLFVFNISPPALTPRIDTINFFGHIRQDNLLFLGSGQSNGSVIEYAIDSRNIGLAGDTAISDNYTDAINYNIGAFHKSGILRGMEVSISTPTSFLIAGGTSFIGGKSIQSSASTYSISNIASADGYWNITLDHNSKIHMGNDAVPSSSFSNLSRSSSKVVLAQAIISSGIITQIKDTRLFINEVENKLIYSVDDGGNGLFKSISAAQIYAANSGSDSSPEIHVLSNVVESNFTINGSIRISFFGDLTLNGTSSILNSYVVVYGTLTITGPILLNNSTLNCIGTLNAKRIDMGSSTMMLAQNSIVEEIYTSIGTDNAIVGPSNRANITLTKSGVDGINVSSARFYLENINLIKTPSIFHCIKLSAGAQDVYVKNSGFEYSVALTPGDIGAAAQNRAGIALDASAQVSNLNVIDSSFKNISAGIYIPSAATLNQFRFLSNRMTSFGEALRVDGALKEFTIADGYFSGAHLSFLNLSGSADDTVVSGKIYGNSFSDVFDIAAPSAPTFVLNNFKSKGITYANNVFRNLSTQNNLFLFKTNSAIFTSNHIYDCSITGGSSFSVFNIANLTNVESNGLTISNNRVNGMTGGRLFVGGGFNAYGNHISISSAFAGSPAIDIDPSNTAILSANPQTIFENNILNIGASKKVSLRATRFNLNYLECGQITLKNHYIGSNPSNSMEIKDNIFIISSSDINKVLVLNKDMNPGSAPAGMFAPTLHIGENLFKYMVGSNTGLMIKADINGSNRAKISIKNNDFISIDAMTNVISVGDNVADDKNAQYDIIGNTIICDSLTPTTRAIVVNYGFTTIAANNFQGNYATDIINISSGAKNIFAHTNVIKNTNTGAAGIVYDGGTISTGISIFKNKGIIESKVFSPLNALINVGWAAVIDSDGYNLKNTLDTATLIMGLDGIEAGTYIDSISCSLFAAGAVNKVKLEVYLQNASNIPGSTLIGTAGNSAASANQVMSTSIGRYLAPGEILLARISFVSGGAVNNKIGKITAQVMY